MIRPHEGETNFFSRVVHAARDVVVVKINCIRVADTDPRIALRSNWSCLSLRIWFKFGERDVTSGKVITTGGNDFELLTKASKSNPNKRDVNYSRHT